MSSEPAPRVIRRVLSPAQVSDYGRLVAAAIELATEGGYDAVDMRTVAAQAGMSTAKAYQLVGTKDQLLLEALMSLGDASSERLKEHPVEGATPGARLRSVLHEILAQVGRRPLLYRALYRAYVASTPTLGEISGSEGFGHERAGWIMQAMLGGDASAYSDEELDEVASIVATLLLGAMVGVAAGRDVDEVIRILDRGVTRLLGE